MDMDNVSKMLKEARLAKGLSLEEAEAATSIRKLYLDAVEEGEFDKIPGDVFTKGIIRTYGNFLGLNGPDLVNIYKAQNSGLTKEAVAPKPIRMVEKNQYFSPDKAGKSILRQLAELYCGIGFGYRCCRRHSLVYEYRFFAESGIGTRRSGKQHAC